MSKRRAASDSDDAPTYASAPSKKSKTTAASGASSTAPKVTSDGDEYWEISDGGKRRVVISSFRNTPMVSVREYYSDNGQMKPGKKGISMTVPQFAALVAALPAIERSLRKRGHDDVPRPDYGSGSGGSKDRGRVKVGDDEGDGEDEDEGDEEEVERDDDEDVVVKDQDDDEEDDDIEEKERRMKEKKQSTRKTDKKGKRDRGRKNFEETSDEDEG